MRLLSWLGVCVLLIAAVPALAAKRALVIGNAAYLELDTLRNTIGDAEGYAGAFRDLGFDVTFLSDLDEVALEAAVVGFVDGIAPGDEVAFVYAGHGWSADGVNYLIPTDAPANGSVRLLSRRSLPLKNGANGVLDDIAAQGAALSLAIIDACRDNPFASPGTRSAGASRGLARIEPVQGSFVIYSAGEGQTALDGLLADGPEQRFSVFTRNFLPLLTSDMYLEDAVFEAQERTAQDARSQDHLQIPAVYRQKLGKTCLKARCGQRPVPEFAPVAVPAPHTGPRQGWTHRIEFAHGTRGQVRDIAVHPVHDEVAVLLSRSGDESSDREAEILYFGRDGSALWTAKLVSLGAAKLTFQGDRMLALGEDGLQWLDRGGRVVEVLRFRDGKAAHVSQMKLIGPTTLRAYGEIRQGDERMEDRVFDIDTETGLISDPVFAPTEDLYHDSVRIAQTGHFLAVVPTRAAEDPYKPLENDGIYGPDGTLLRLIAVTEKSSIGVTAYGQVALGWTEPVFDIWAEVFFLARGINYWLHFTTWAGELHSVLVRHVRDTSFPSAVLSDGGAMISVLMTKFDAPDLELLTFDAKSHVLLHRSQLKAPERRMISPNIGAHFSDGGTVFNMLRFNLRGASRARPDMVMLFATGADGTIPEEGAAK
ncbi:MULTISPECIES: caspase family protein [unclassified Marinovum]